MQRIFHHNSSGNDAFTGDLLERDVLKAISLHPVKQSPYQYRLHNFINERKIIDMRQRYLFLQRETYRLRKELMSNLESYRLTTKSNVAAHAEFESEIDSDFDNFILKKNENLSDECLKNRFYLKPSLLNIKIPKKREERYDYDFFTRSLF
jgi:chondroitin sulfate synthase